MLTSHHVWTESNLAGSALLQDFLSEERDSIIEPWAPSPIRLAKPRMVRPGLEPVMADGESVVVGCPPKRPESEL